MVSATFCIRRWISFILTEWIYKKGQGRTEHFFEVSYLKFQKEDWAYCSRKVVIRLLDKVGERLWKKRTIVLNRYWLSNRKQKNFLSGLWPSVWWDDTCVRLCWAVRTKTCSCGLGGDGVRTHGNQLSGLTCGDLEQWLWRPPEVRQVSNSLRCRSQSHTPVCLLPHHSLPPFSDYHAQSLQREHFPDVPSLLPLPLVLWGARKWVDSQVERSPVERFTLMVATNDKY